MNTIEQRHTDITEIERLFQLQHPFESLQKLKKTSVKERIARIKKIEKYLLDETHQKEWTAALHYDLHKSKEEAITTELVPILTCMKHIYDELHRWVENEPVSAPWVMAGLKSYVKYEPKGHVMVIAPWNYPLQLAINPVIHAIAAGNVILLKPSEVAAATSKFLHQMISDLFDETEIAVVEGGVPETTALLEKPFHHIFFTGSPSVGKIVMRAAAENLTSITLELGGKSPVIIDGTMKMDTAAGKVAFGKCLNAGQTCIAPDYVLIQEKYLDDFVEAYKKQVNSFYNAEGKGIDQSENYPRIINSKNAERIKSYIDDAVAKGAVIAFEGKTDTENRLITPYVLTNVTYDMKIMQDEIFGPVLPIMTFEKIEEVPQRIAAKEKPLALYILSKNRRNTKFILDNTTSGGASINELMVTSINPYLPFGGSNHSGMGKSNGKYSFIEFSNERGVVKRNWGTFKIVYPPFNKTLIKWLAKIARL